MEPSRTEETIMWTCPKCKNQESYQDIKPLIDEILNICGSWKAITAQEVQPFMEKLNPRFHPQHFVYMRVAQEIVRTLQDNASGIELKLRAHIMRSLAKIYTTLEPGLTRRRGMTLMETGSVLLEVALKD